jgi:hypothetical protein
MLLARTQMNKHPNPDRDRIRTPLSTPVLASETPPFDGKLPALTKHERLAEADHIRRRMFGALTILESDAAVTLDESWSKMAAHLRRSRSAKFWLGHADSSLSKLLKAVEREVI